MNIENKDLNRNLFGDSGEWRIEAVAGHSPVRKIKPPSTTTKAEIQTIASILLKRNKNLFANTGKDDGLHFLSKMHFAQRKRQLTDQEAKKILALISWYKESQ